MKFIFLSVSAFLLGLQVAQAQGSLPTQDAEIVKTKKNILTRNMNTTKPSKDYIMLQMGYHGWILGDTNTKINLRNRGHDLGVYFNYEFPLSRKAWSLSTGIGVGSSNIYLDSMIAPLTDSFRFIKFIPDSVTDYIRYKMSTNYLDFPVEFRYFGNPVNRNRGFKASLGLKLGSLMNAHNKGYRVAYGTTIREKESNRRYHQQWRIGTTARIGWGNFSVYGNYQLSSVFKQGNIQSITPWSVGFCISGL